MIPEIGHFAIIIALSLAIIQAVLPVVGAQRNILSWMNVARPAVYGQLTFLLIAFGCLLWSFINNDFSVRYVATNSNSALPLQYRISAVWGAHEGSLLLWVLILAGWSFAVARLSKNLPLELVARVLGVMGFISIGFLLFILLTSNPFDRLFPAALDGRDLNPLLQDPGLIFHPPMLYMGYVGFSVAFAFAIAALLGGKLDATWARWSRPWTTVAWAFLTMGIALGSWWAYYELGWGGWWFWDPVENASFMPWLVGTALIHSLAVTEKRGVFKPWTVLLAIFAFSLSLLGTFLVRSGVLVSVHAFATDPARGVFILAFLVLVIGTSLALYAWRAPSVRSTGTFRPFSRESALLINNVLFVVAALSVLLGTLYPLLMDALGAGKISVGPPYFATVFAPLMLPMAFLVGIGPAIRWKSDEPGRVARQLVTALFSGIVASLIFGYFFIDGANAVTGVAIAIAFWVIFSAFRLLVQRVRNSSSRVPRSFYGMTLAHAGLGVFIIGVTLVTSQGEEQDLRLAPGEQTTLAGYTFEFDGVTKLPGSNYVAERGRIRISRDGKSVATLEPEKRVYRVQMNPMTEAGIDAGLTRDLFVALGEPLDQGAWSLRIYHKPFIRWIWFGALFMAIGGLLAASDRRYKIKVAADKRSTGQATSPSQQHAAASPT